MSDFINIGNAAQRLETAPAFAPFSGVLLMYDEENAFFAGDESGRVLYAYCPWATQEMANNMLASISGFRYQPFEAAGAILDPTAELGDAVSVGGTVGLLASITTTFDALCASDIAAPADEEVDHEYPYESPTSRELNRKVTLGRDYFGAKITRANGLEITKTASDGTTKSRMKLNSDQMAFFDDDGQAAIYFDVNTGRYKFVGDVVVDGNIDMSGGSITWGGNNPAPNVDSILENRYGIEYTTLGKAEISSPLIKGEEIQVSGSFQCLDDDGAVSGYVGAAYGMDAGGNVTFGAVLARSYSSAAGLGSNYIIVTDAGVRMQCGSNNITVTDTGAYFNDKPIATVE